MIVVYLKRWYTPGDMGTFGLLHAPGFQCCTCELPWKNNQKMVSCIPEGEYFMTKGTHNPGSPKAYWCYELQNVPGRSHIEIHRGNTPKDVKGCILVGETFGCSNGTWGVLNSRKTHDEWMAVMRGEEAILRVVRAEVSAVL